MKLLFSSEQIDQRIEELAQEILRETQGSQPLFVTLLRGSMPFTAKLLFEIARQAPDFHPELDYMTVKTYGDERCPGKPKIIMDLSPDTVVAGRTVIILDDVLDKGITSSFVAAALMARDAKHTLLAVLVEKDIVRANQPHADFACFHAGKEWLVGMGMDDASVTKDGYRWLSEINVVET